MRPHGLSQVLLSLCPRSPQPSVPVPPHASLEYTSGSALLNYNFGRARPHFWPATGNPVHARIFSFGGGSAACCWALAAICPCSAAQPERKADNKNIET